MKHKSTITPTGVLDAADSANVAAHVESCTECATAVEQLRAMKTRLAALPRDIRPARDLRSGHVAENR
jgi:anti-sigma factor RsiW